MGVPFILDEFLLPACHVQRIRLYLSEERLQFSFILGRIPLEWLLDRASSD
jgi:hypothetical protein